MSIKSDAFVVRVQDNRGKIKSQKHIDMLHEISYLGSDLTIDQAEHKKMVGITFIHQVAVELSTVDQELFWKEFMELPNKKITDAKLLLMKYV
jgi:hypothetical protein